MNINSYFSQVIREVTEITNIRMLLETEIISFQGVWKPVLNKLTYRCN